MASIEIESIQQLQAHLADNRPMTNVVVQGLDLTPFESELNTRDLSGTVFLGTILARSTYDTACAAGAVIFRPPIDTPFSPYRSSLYTPEELFEGFVGHDHASYSTTLDEITYQYTRRDDAKTDILHTLACRLHDHGITDALEEKIVGRNVVAIMGGHSMARTDARFRDVATIARALTEDGYLLASGGGPGAMEATHLGAWLAHRPANDLGLALDVLAECPQYVPREQWLATALAVKEMMPQVANSSDKLADSLGIPTWLYGHEPPTVFATDIAKYFSNSVREEGLLAIATSGVIFSPGSAGTIQEVFQDAAQNHYRSFGNPSPMVFLGMDYWQSEKPVFPLLEELAIGHDYAELLSITDDPAEAIAAIRDHRR